MPKHCLCLPFALLALSLPAQKIPAKLSPWPEAPVVYEYPGKAVFLFYDIFRNEAIVQAVETDTAFAPLRQVEAPRVSRGELDAFTYIIGRQNDTAVTAYFIVDETDIWAYELRLADFSIRNKKIITLDSKEYLLGGFIRGGKCGLLARRLGKKDSGQLLLFDDLSAAGPPREIPLSGDTRLLNKQYRPVVSGSAIEQAPKALIANRTPAYWNEAFAGIGIEQPPHRAAAADKIWFGRDAVWFSSDIQVKAANGRAPAIELNALYWSDLSFRTDTVHFTDVPNGAYSPQRGTHVVFDDNLFSLYLRDDVMSLRVSDIGARNTLWQHELPASPDTMDFFSSPVLLPKGVFNREKEVLTADKFIAKFLKFTPFLQVRRDGTDYVLAIGGYQENNGGGMVYTPGSPGVSTPYGAVAGTPGGWSMGGWGRSPSYTTTSSFYVVLHGDGQGPAGGIDHLPRVRYSNTLLGLVSDKVENKAGKRNGGGLFGLFGRYWYGYYDQKERGYFMGGLELEKR